ncbi:MAG: AbrB/MazE/SpoVT family DNA-binding domain-containing protein [Lentisphaeria bacterium]|nr:AbrB/MazE/SpoVT family DNA-binding domain-containing protein [Lentisphaeria bacterium]
MLKTLTRHGNSATLIIERPVLELLNADLDTVFDVTTDGTALIITPVKDAKRLSAIHSSMERIGSRYRKTFEELTK